MKSLRIWGSWTAHRTVLGMLLLFFLILFLLRGKWSGNWCGDKVSALFTSKSTIFAPNPNPKQTLDNCEQSRLGGMRQWRRNWRGERCWERLCVRKFYLAGAAEPTCPAPLVWSPNPVAAFSGGDPALPRLLSSYPAFCYPPKITRTHPIQIWIKNNNDI